MTWVAVLLIGIGVADVVRGNESRRATWAAAAAAPAVTLAVALASGLHATIDLVVLGAGSIGSAAWIVLSARTQRTGRGAVTALVTLAATLGTALALSGWASSPGGVLGRWLAWADLPGPAWLDPGRVLLLAGLALANVLTGNIVVRLALLAIGALRPGHVDPADPPVQPADRLKGGRLIGPMERLVILGLGLAGELGAAGLVIAAKGLLRFPELQASGRNGTRGATGIDDVTEYFLVGSFVSWLVALGTLALAAG